MTTAILTKTYKPFQMEELAPGQALAEAHETWSKLTTYDKMKLAEIMGIEAVLGIERIYQKSNA